MRLLLDLPDGDARLPTRISNLLRDAYDPEDYNVRYFEAIDTITDVLQENGYEYEDAEYIAHYVFEAIEDEHAARIADPDINNYPEGA